MNANQTPCAGDYDVRATKTARAAYGRRVLVVDDDAEVRQTLAEVLEMDDYETLQAGDAIAALMILRETPDIGVLLTDLTMPGADGIALIRMARGMRPGLPAILLTGYAEKVDDASAVSTGDFHIMSKPVESGRLIQKVALLLA